jgi:maltooligosyltrehalose trehalohydrolase
VELVVGDGPRLERSEMRSLGASGWYESDRDLTAGARYAFSVDGGPATPDPRSRSQPDGVHASSCVDEGEAVFPWSKSERAFRAAPLSSAIVYELHVGAFSTSGTFAGVVDHLDHLVDLGVTHVELMPVVEFHGARGWGYDGVDLFSPHHVYGGPRGLRALVDACHARNLGVIVDVVYNHLGPTGNYLDRFGPYFTDEHKTPWGRAINLDARGSDEVRRFLLDNARMWLVDYHVDGLRLDAVHELFDSSATHFLAQLAHEKANLESQLEKPLVLIAESDLNDARVVRSLDAHGLGIDAQWSDDFHHALHVALTGERTGCYADYGEHAALDDVAHALAHGFVYDGRSSRQRGRTHGAPLGDASLARLLGYCQTHEQIGNRANGDRLSHLTSTERVMIAAALVMTSPFVPMLFMGEEWAASSPFLFFCDHEAQLAQSVRDGRRRELGAFGSTPDDIPDPQAESTFVASKLDFAERARAPHAGVLQWYRDLARLRRRTPDLAAGAPMPKPRVEDHALVVERGDVAIVANFAAVAARTTLPRAASRVLLSSTEIEVRANKITMPHASVAIVALER